MPVIFLFAAIVKEVARGLLHPFRKVGDQACEGLGLYSEACLCQTRRGKDEKILTLTKRMTVVYIVMNAATEYTL
jgi:hypothetical protein